MSELKNRITADMKSAMKSKDKETLKAIRMILGAIKQKEIDERIELDEVAISKVIQKMLKQRKDSIAQFKEAKREDLVAVEEAEFSVIMRYMPKQLSESEVSSLVAEVISTTGANSMADMGKLMGLLKSKLDGKADMALVSSLIKSQLS
jgi:uncharacterized protein YqeY